MAQSTTYKKAYKNTPPAAEHEPLPEEPAAAPCEGDPRDFEADYTEDRSVAVLAERRRQALANNTRSFVDVDLP